jgi:hypothetical protein
MNFNDKTTIKRLKNSDIFVINNAKLNHSLNNPSFNTNAGPIKVFIKTTGKEIKNGIEIGLKKPSLKYLL